MMRAYLTGRRQRDTAQTREKLATQVDSELLANIRALAKAEGRQLQSFVDEALAGLIEQLRQARPRPHVMAAYEASHERYASLYEKLAR
jgi:uncharacterized protein YicC (UPF0701 family)